MQWNFSHDPQAVSHPLSWQGRDVRSRILISVGIWQLKLQLALGSVCQLFKSLQVQSCCRWPNFGASKIMRKFSSLLLWGNFLRKEEKLIFFPLSGENDSLGRADCFRAELTWYLPPANDSGYYNIPLFSMIYFTIFKNNPLGQKHVAALLCVRVCACTDFYTISQRPGSFWPPVLTCGSLEPVK